MLRVDVKNKPENWTVIKDVKKKNIEFKEKSKEKQQKRKNGLEKERKKFFEKN